MHVYFIHSCSTCIDHWLSNVDCRLISLPLKLWTWEWSLRSKYAMTIPCSVPTGTWTRWKSWMQTLMRSTCSYVRGGCQRRKKINRSRGRFLSRWFLNCLNYFSLNPKIASLWTVCLRCLLFSQGYEGERNPQKNVQNSKPSLDSNMNKKKKKKKAAAVEQGPGNVCFSILWLKCCIYHYELIFTKAIQGCITKHLKWMPLLKQHSKKVSSMQPSQYIACCRQHPWS